MITLHEAFLKAKSDAGKIGFTLLTSCSDYGEFWGFHFRPSTHNPDGVGDTTVNKKTGEIAYFIPPMDIKLWRNRKPVPIEQFDEYSVAV